MLCVPFERLIRDAIAMKRHGEWRVSSLLSPILATRHLKPRNPNLRKPASVCFSNFGSSIASHLALATSSSSFNKHLFAHGLTRSAGRNLGRIRAYARDEEDEKRPTATWHYQLFSSLVDDDNDDT
ncbi:hypothetical protein Bca52824_061449 [Brassica carinata]|uniref:Uncharacterized protein n=1 Tax=Brassica carinata TaxID=52824 RepID=A0A8X7UHP2_BRACI|nr:hypothetical protein Bca52824_061449 [Brassica carinata]